MDSNKDIRWKQRFDNFNRAFSQLTIAVSLFDTLDDLAKEGLVQRFEYTFELAWKTLKDYLISKGEDIQFARDVIKKAYQFEIIEDGEMWLLMLDRRNAMSHTYNEAIFHEVCTQIVTQFYPEIDKLFSYLKTEYEQ